MKNFAPISDADTVGLNLPTGIADRRPQENRSAGDHEAAREAATAVAKQTKHQ